MFSPAAVCGSVGTAIPQSSSVYAAGNFRSGPNGQPHWTATATGLRPRHRWWTALVYVQLTICAGGREPAKRFRARRGGPRLGDLIGGSGVRRHHAGTGADHAQNGAVAQPRMSLVSFLVADGGRSEKVKGVALDLAGAATATLRDSFLSYSIGRKCRQWLGAASVELKWTICKKAAGPIAHHISRMQLSPC